MFFKKKTKKKDTNDVKNEIIIWALRQNVEIHMMDIIFGDYRDGPGFENKIWLPVFFKTNTDLQKYKEIGFISKLKEEIIRLFEETFHKYVKDKLFDFYFDSHENVELECNGNYLRYTCNRNQSNI